MAPMERGARRYRAGETILTEGETGREVLILVSGTIAIWRGRTELGRLSGSGDVIGELAALTGRPRSASVLAATEVELLVVPAEMTVVLKQKPEILRKISSAIEARFQIARNKAAMYAGEAALGRRLLLTEILVQREFERDMRKAAQGAAVRKKMRRLVDESLESHGGDDDPRLLKNVADENQILTDYLRALGEKPWLDEAIALRLFDLDGRYRLARDEEGLAGLKIRATLTMDAIELLAEYEAFPGVVRVMDLKRLEEILPPEEKLKALKKTVRTKEGEMDERRAAFVERRIIEAIENLKMTAGRDQVQYYRAAAVLEVETEYEEELRRTMERADTSSTFIDLATIK
jgi:CRP-like cAMP-binding protein